MASSAPSGMVPGLPAEYTELVDQMREVQAQLSKHIQAQNQLETQLNENNMVKEELAQSPPAVYKMSGRVLVKQDLSDAQSTVTRRLEYITTEMCVPSSQWRSGAARPPWPPAQRVVAGEIAPAGHPRHRHRCEYVTRVGRQRHPPRPVRARACCCIRRKRVDATIKSTQDKLNDVRSKIMAAQQRLQQQPAQA